MGQKHSKRRKHKEEYKIERDNKENTSTENVTPLNHGKLDDSEPHKGTQLTQENVQVIPEKHLQESHHELPGEQHPESSSHDHVSTMHENLLRDPTSFQEEEQQRKEEKRSYAETTSRAPEVGVIREEELVTTTGTTSGFSGPVSTVGSTTSAFSGTRDVPSTTTGTTSGFSGPVSTVDSTSSAFSGTRDVPSTVTGTTSGFSGPVNTTPGFSGTREANVNVLHHEEMGHEQMRMDPREDIREHQQRRDYLEREHPSSSTYTSSTPGRFDEESTRGEKRKSLTEKFKEKLHMKPHNREHITHINFEEWRRVNNIAAPTPLRNPALDTQRVLTRLNEIRAAHSAPPLILDDELQKQAQLWAENMALKNKLSHSAKGCENVAFFSKQPGMDDTAYVVAALDSWYDEVKNYDFRKHRHQLESSNFTAMVWKSVYLVGVGVYEDQGLVFVCMSFDPFANVTDEFEENVHPVREQAVRN